MQDYVDYLPHVNASLNSLATVLLLVGYGMIRQGRELAHRRTMISCFCVSVLFLVSYLIYHGLAGSKRFPDYPPQAIRYFYFFILLTHVVLAAAVPFLAITTIYLGLRDRRQAHRALAKWTFPIWLYVSVTGVVVYVVLYHLYKPLPAAAIIERSVISAML
jgi:uncharacterized membrane protein YozB (DUF420 family)